eukprot:Rhum_TRINITY_DN12947_c2_g1::Rhum_TRINITY_DN12947_c2_g1_i1::g.55740::m.55740
MPPTTPAATTTPTAAAATPTTSTPPGYLHFCVTHAADVAAAAALQALSRLWDAQPPAVREAYAADAAALARTAREQSASPPPPPPASSGGSGSSSSVAAGGGFVLFCQSKKKELGSTLGRSGGQAALGRLWGEEPAEARTAWNRRAEVLVQEYESSVRQVQRLDALAAVVGGGGGG